MAFFDSKSHNYIHEKRRFNSLLIRTDDIVTASSFILELDKCFDRYFTVFEGDEATFEDAINPKEEAATDIFWLKKEIHCPDNSTIDCVLQLDCLTGKGENKTEKKFFPMQFAYEVHIKDGEIILFKNEKIYEKRKIGSCYVEKESHLEKKRKI